MILRGLPSLLLLIPHTMPVYLPWTILAAVERPTVFPHSGRIVPEVNHPAIREILLGSYRIVYRVKDEVVEILTVYHGHDSWIHLD